MTNDVLRGQPVPSGADRPRGPPSERMFNLTTVKPLEFNRSGTTPCGWTSRRPTCPRIRPQRARSPDAARWWPDYLTGDHGPDHPALGIRTGKQRLDSTHIISNIATLTRLGLFCETMRLFLRALRWEHPSVAEGLLGRYLKEEDEAFGDAFRSVPGTSTGWWTGSVARLLPSWRSTGCWSGCCGSSAMWANTGTGARGTM